jgi:spectrin beta
MKFMVWQVEECCDQLAKRWKELIQLAEGRSNRLDLVLKAQQFYAETNEVESWLNEKQNMLKSPDYGKNEEVAKRFLTKHKVNRNESILQVQLCSSLP